jgi:hypothetical protein
VFEPVEFVFCAPVPNCFGGYFGYFGSLGIVDVGDCRGCIWHRGTRGLGGLDLRGEEEDYREKNYREGERDIQGFKGTSLLRYLNKY